MLIVNSLSVGFGKIVKSESRLVFSIELNGPELYFSVILTVLKLRVR